jgi:molybdopterin-binding protein
MPEVDRIRIEVAFDGGQIMGSFVSAASADALEKALAEGTKVTAVLDTEDGPMTVVLARVVYFKRYARDTHVGFVA